MAVNKQRGRLSSCVNELHVGDSVCRSTQDILSGLHQHFKGLATPADEKSFDSDYMELVEMALRGIRTICRNSSNRKSP